MKISFFKSLLNLTFTSLRVLSAQVPVAIHTHVAARALHEALTDTATGHQVVTWFGPGFTLTTVLRAHRVTVTG